MQVEGEHANLKMTSRSIGNYHLRTPTLTNAVHTVNDSYGQKFRPFRRKLLWKSAHTEAAFPASKHGLLLTDEEEKIMQRGKIVRFDSFLGRKVNLSVERNGN